MLPRIALRGLALLAAILLSAAPIRQTAQGQSSGAPTTWHVVAGAGTPDASVATLKYYPNSITIDAGDTISWSSVADAHTVTFLSGAPRPDPLDPANENPIGGSSYDGTGVVSSGIVLPIPGRQYALTFTNPGTYTYVCTIHPGMGGQVVVQNSGAAYPQTQAQIDAAVAPQEQQDVAGILSAVQAFQPTSVRAANGSTTYNLSMGLGNGSASSLRFLPSDFSVNAGDTVVWTNTDTVEPHTVTFVPAGQQAPVFPEDPASAAPAGGSTYDGTALTSSGIALPAGVPGSQPYSLSFPRPGTYTYICVIHAELGMVGTITVRPVMPSGPPNTGVGPGPDRTPPDES